MTEPFLHPVCVGGQDCGPGAELARELACFRPSGFAPPEQIVPEARALLARLEHA